MMTLPLPSSANALSAANSPITTLLPDQHRHACQTWLDTLTVVCGMQDHYAVSAYVKRQIRSALQRMVDAGRLEAVPNHASLFRLGGVIRQLSQEAGIEWPRIKPGTGLLDPRVLSPLSLPRAHSDVGSCTESDADSAEAAMRQSQR